MSRLIQIILILGFINPIVAQKSVKESVQKNIKQKSAPAKSEETQAYLDMLETAYADDDVEILSIPDIESVNYGRGVGYGIVEHVPPKDIGFISATQIRNQINNEDDSWKENVDSKIHDKVVKYLEK